MAFTTPPHGSSITRREGLDHSGNHESRHGRSWWKKWKIETKQDMEKKNKFSIRKGT